MQRPLRISSHFFEFTQCGCSLEDSNDSPATVGTHPHSPNELGCNRRARRSEFALSKTQHGGFMACQTPLPLSQTLASEMTLFELDESLSLLMESATEAAAGNSGEIPDELRQACSTTARHSGRRLTTSRTISSRRNLKRGMPTPRSIGYRPGRPPPKTRSSALRGFSNTSWKVAVCGA